MQPDGRTRRNVENWNVRFWNGLGRHRVGRSVMWGPSWLEVWCVSHGFPTSHSCLESFWFTGSTPALSVQIEIRRNSLSSFINKPETGFSHDQHNWTRGGIGNNMSWIMILHISSRMNRLGLDILPHDEYHGISSPRTSFAPHTRQSHNTTVYLRFGTWTSTEEKP